jgi:filamentous hemagglutinin family protein
MPENICSANCVITGGTRPGGGANLFHSFGQFNIGPQDISTFQNGISFDVNGTTLAAGLPTSNILARVTGGDLSSIYGTIQTSGFGNANLFLMNPAGFLFGPNATVNVGGMVAFTSADYLRLEGIGANGMFHADPTQTSVLTSAPVAAFGFLSSNPNAITVSGSQFTVTEGSGISLVGGDITIQSDTLGDGTVQSARLTASGGQINLASVASQGEVSAADYAPSSGMAMGNIGVSEGALLDVSANAAGTVRIRGGQLTVDHSTISSDTVDVDGAPIAIDISISDSVSLSQTTLPALTARAFGTGNAGNIVLSSGSLNGTFSTDAFPAALIESHTIGSGRGGDVTILTGPLTVTGDPFAPGLFIMSGTGGEGNGGHVAVTATDVQITSASIDTGANAFGGSGSGGDLTIRAQSLVVDGSSLGTDSLGATAGVVDFEASGLVKISNGFVSNFSVLGENPVRVKADTFILENSPFLSGTRSGDAGNLDVTARIVELSSGGILGTSTVGDGRAGNVHIIASEGLSLLNSFEDFAVSGIFTSSIGDFSSNTQGNAGTITIDTPRLELTNGARVNSITFTSGRGGDVTISNANSVSITGERSFPVFEEVFQGGTRASGIYTNTLGSDLCLGSCGSAGHINMTTDSLALQNGGLIDSGTSNNGQGGNITALVNGQALLSGTMLDGTPGGVFSRTTGTDPGAGGGGAILLKANSAMIENGAQISASSLGPGTAGSVTIEGTASPAQSVLIDGFGSGVFTDTQGTGAGGNIFVNANNVTISNGGTLSAETSGTGHGGTIDVFATDTLSIKDASSVASNSNSLLEDAGNAGTVRLNAHLIDIQSAIISASTVGSGNAGNIVLAANTVTLGASESGRALEQGADVFTRTTGPGQAGNIMIQGNGAPESQTESVTISGFSRVLSESAFGLSEVQGNAGSVSIRAGSFALSENSRLSTASQSSTGDAGNINVVASNQVVLTSNSVLSSGAVEFASGDSGQIAVSAPTIIVENGSQISTNTDFSGNAGEIQLNTNDLQLKIGGQITSSSVINQGAPEFPPSGAAGLITIQGLASPAQSVLIDGAGSGIFTNTEGIGAGGNILMNANSVALRNNAQVSSSSTGTGVAGDINISAGSRFSLTNSSVTTEANQSSGGAIKITTNPDATVMLTNSVISASVLDGTGGGGSVDIDPQFVILQNSQITANAVSGPGGNIFITTNLLLPDSTSIISASSQFGQQGTVTIQSPVSPASGKLNPISQKPLITATMVNQRCAALAGGSISSFTVAGRDSLPAEPGGWLSSPLAFASDSGPKVEAGTPALRNDSIFSVSLRRLPSPWETMKLVDNEWFRGCAS